MSRRRILLDVTRLFSRRFEPIDTGIDRVERGVFEALSENKDAGFLLRFGGYYFCLDGKNFKMLLDNPKSGRLRAYWQLRKLSRSSGKLSSLQLSEFSEFWSLGHSRHDSKFWQALERDSVIRLVLIHDVIPLDFPDTTRRDQIDNFRIKFEAWVKYANVIITPSRYTSERVKAHAPEVGNVFIEPLFVTRFNVERNNIRNEFVILGTIEPRKNHQLLLNVWEKLYEKLGEASPQLYIIGKRGWKNEAVFSFLDQSPLMGRTVFEVGTIDDEALKNRLSSAKALLFPSIAEGFGLPFFEALTAGVPILASDIPVFNEALTKNSQIYLIPLDSTERWVESVTNSTFPDLELKTDLPTGWNEYIQRISNHIKIYKP